MLGTLVYLSLNFSASVQDPDSSVEIIPYTEEMKQALAFYDQGVTGMQRAFNLDVQLNYFKANSVLALDKDGSIVGYGVLQSLVTGPEIGPIYADSQSIGKKLFASLLYKILANASGMLCVITPDCNRALMLEWVRDFGLKLEEKETAACQRMYSKRVLPFNFDKIFATWGFQNNII